MKTVSIKVCTAVEGEYIREILAENGIRVVLVPHQESDTMIIGDLGMVEVLVGDADVQRAAQLLADDLAQDDSIMLD